MKLSNKLYDVLKDVALLILPIIAFIALVCAICKVDNAEYVAVMATAFGTLLGTLLKISSVIYNKPFEIPIDELTYIDDEEVKAEEV